MTTRLPFDLDALEVEAEGDAPFSFTWNGREFTMPTLSQLDWQDSLAYFGGATNDERLAMLLGDQLDEFRAKPMSTARLGALLDEWLRFQGIDEGKSAASSGS